jgi:hypothetical protein
LGAFWDILGEFFKFKIIFEISFNLIVYFSFTTTTQYSFNVKISDIFIQKLYLVIYFQNPSHFLATKVNLNQIQKYFGFGFLGPKPVS